LNEGGTTSRSPARVRLARVIGWIYLGIGALFLAGMLAPLWWPLPHDGEDGRGEWLPLALPLLLLFPITFTFAGYRVLRHPPLHRRRTLLLGFIGLTCAWLAWFAFRQMS
jgi:hypothetical protein